MTDFEIYKIYLAIKLHFNSSYDYFKYNGQVNATITSYNKRKDHYTFKKLARLYNEQQIKHFFVSNIIVNDNMWIGDALTPECLTIYKNWQKKIESLQYTFINDCKTIINFFAPDEDLTKVSEQLIENLFKVKDHQHPVILKMVLAEKINFETFIIMNSIFKFVDQFNKQISDTIIWPEFYIKCKKYRPFLEYDVNKFKNVFKKIIDF